MIYFLLPHRKDKPCRSGSKGESVPCCVEFHCGVKVALLEVAGLSGIAR